MKTLKVLSIALAGSLGAGAAFAQAQTLPEHAPAGPVMGSADQVPSSSPATLPPTNTPDQANSATYPSTSHPGNGRTPEQNADPQAASSQHQRSALRTAAASGNTGSIASGMDVKSPAGQVVGTVVDVVKNSSGRPTYVVVADQSGGHTAIPYAQARQMVHGNEVVVEDQHLQKAPKIPQHQPQDQPGTAWQGRADGYWNKHGAKEQGSKDRGSKERGSQNQGTKDRD